MKRILSITSLLIAAAFWDNDVRSVESLSWNVFWAVVFTAITGLLVLDESNLIFRGLLQQLLQPFRWLLRLVLRRKGVYSIPKRIGV